MGGKYTLIINVLNKDLVPVTFIDNDIPGLPSYYKDTLIDYLSLGTASFEFTILKSKNNIIQDYSRFFNDETCFSFEKNGKQYAVFPAGSDGFYETDTEITYKCLSLDRELSLEYVDKFDNSSTHTLQWYIDYFELISNNQIEIGRNDVADYTRVIKYDSQDTKLNRLLSLINNFDAEFEFITKLTNNGAVDKIILNIVKKRDDSGKGGIGAIRDDVELVYGKNVKGIERTYNFEFFNASKVIGKDGTNWNSSEFSYINSDGVEEFYKRKNDDTAFAPLSAQKYPAHLRKDSSDIWLRKNFETEYTTPAQMWGYIVQQFKSYAYPQITYKIKTNSNLVSQALDGKLPIQIGDTVTIEDDNFSNEQGDFGLILRARATEIKSSDSNPETNEITFENFVELQNDLSDDLMTQVNQLVDAATPFRAELSTTNGTQFKNGTGSTTLSAHIFKGSATTETIADSYEWSKDGTVVAPTQTITVDASGVADKAVYSFKATVAGKVVASQSVTITNVYDGIAGKDGTGVKTTTITYAGSTSGTTAPTSGWNSQVPNVPAGQYLWTKTVWAYTDNTSKTGYSVGKMGNTGPAGPPGSNGEPGKIVSDTEPTTRFKGLTWKYSGTTDLTASDGTVIKPNTEYYYNGTHWVINYFSVNNFEAESITSDKINGKNLTITDGEFISKTTNGPVSTSTEIKDNHIAISKKDGTVNTRHDIALDSEQGLAQKFTNINTGFYRTAGINYQGPFTSDSDGNYAQLTPQGTKLSTDVPWTKLSLMNNFNGNIEYSIINGTVYISASGVGVPAMTAGQWKQAAQLPTGSSAIPIRANRIAAGDSGDGLSWALLSNQAGGIFIRCSANKAPTPNLFNATLPYPIG